MTPGPNQFKPIQTGELSPERYAQFNDIAAELVAMCHITTHDRASNGYRPRTVACVNGELPNNLVVAPNGRRYFPSYVADVGFYNVTGGAGGTIDFDVFPEMPGHADIFSRERVKDGISSNLSGFGPMTGDYHRRTTALDTRASKCLRQTLSDRTGEAVTLDVVNLRPAGAVTSFKRYKPINEVVVSEGVVDKYGVTDPEMRPVSAEEVGLTGPSDAPVQIIRMNFSGAPVVMVGTERVADKIEDLIRVAGQESGMPYVPHLIGKVLLDNIEI